MTRGILVLFVFVFFSQCKKDTIIIEEPEGGEAPAGYIFGADLSYLNQILDHGGIFKENSEIKDPYQIFNDNGTNLARLRIWHNPKWTKEVYSPAGPQLYNDLFDVEKAISLVKEQGMETMLDFHYSDNWADPGKQEIPDAWLEIRDIEVLKDSVYNYTFKTLKYLDDKGLMPEYVQIGNETNCGMLYTNAPSGFPACNGCNGEWQNLRGVINSGIKAIRDVSAESSIKSKIILHVADPKNVDWWFENVINNGEVNDFEIIGFSYYPIWHTDVTISELPGKVSGFRTKFNKDVIILETAYPWTDKNNDNYGNIFGSGNELSGYPFEPSSQLELLKQINQKMIDGGGIGVVYWEPGWITSDLKDQWGTGSSWENNAFFDYEGNLNQSIDYMTSKYN